MLDLLGTFSWQELRRHPWRAATALVAIMLGVALGFAVHVINQSALDEFARAVRSGGGQPDLQLQAMQGSLPENLYAEAARQPQAAEAVPWLEASVLLQPGGAASAPAAEPASAPASPAPAASQASAAQ